MHTFLHPEGLDAGVLQPACDPVLRVSGLHDNLRDQWWLGSEDILNLLQDAPDRFAGLSLRLPQLLPRASSRPQHCVVCDKAMQRRTHPQADGIGWHVCPTHGVWIHAAVLNALVVQTCHDRARAARTVMLPAA